MPGYFTLLSQGLTALLLGLLVGIEREYSQAEEESLFAGARTFSIISLIGFVTALISQVKVPWAFPVALAAVAGLAIASYTITARGKHKGATTEFVALLVFLLGALVYWGYPILAAGLAVTVTIILSLKAPLHQFAHLLKPLEIKAALQFAIISVIILPLLPNQTFDPFEVLNPRLIWWMVVLISGVNMAGYVLMKAFGAIQGTAITGFLGGLASSTATTLSFSRRARDHGGLARPLALGIMVATLTMFFRVLFLTLSLNRAVARVMVASFLLLILIGVAGAYLLRGQEKGSDLPPGEIRNPLELATAIKFGVIFAAILFASRVAEQNYGTAGIFAAAALGGIADVDAVTLSMCRLASTSGTPPAVAASGILIAASMNGLVKGAMAVVIGGKALGRFVAPGFAVLTLVGFIAATLITP